MFRDDDDDNTDRNEEEHAETVDQGDFCNMN